MTRRIVSFGISRLGKISTLSLRMELLVDTTLCLSILEILLIVPIIRRAIVHAYKIHREFTSTLDAGVLTQELLKLQEPSELQVSSI